MSATDRLSELPEETLSNIVAYSIRKSAHYKNMGYNDRLSEAKRLYTQAKSLRLVNTALSRLPKTRTLLYTYAWKVWSTQEAIAFLPPAITLPGGAALYGPPHRMHLAYAMYCQMGQVVKRVTRNDPDALRGMLAYLKERKAHVQAELTRLDVLPTPGWRPADIPTLSLVDPLANTLPQAQG